MCWKRQITEEGPLSLSPLSQSIFLRNIHITTTRLSHVWSPSTMVEISFQPSLQVLICTEATKGHLFIEPAHRAGNVNPTSDMPSGHLLAASYDSWNNCSNYGFSCAHIPYSTVRACGPVRSDPDSSVIEIVVLMEERGDEYYAIYIFNIASSSWRVGMFSVDRHFNMKGTVNTEEISI